MLKGSLLVNFIRESHLSESPSAPRLKRGGRMIGEDAIAGGSPYSTPQFGRNRKSSDFKAAVLKDPVGYRLTFGVADDLVRPWFSVSPTATDITPPVVPYAPYVSRLQNAKADSRILVPKHLALPENQPIWEGDLARLLASAIGKERQFGRSIMVFGANGKQPNADISNEKTLKLDFISVYGTDKFTDKAINEIKTDIRYGLTKTYEITLGKEKFEVDWSHVVEFNTREGESALAPVMDDLEAYQQDAYSAAQAFARFGPGFPDLEFAGADKKQLIDMWNSGEIEDITARGMFIHNEKGKLKFQGIGPITVKPDDFINVHLRRISIGTGIPISVLIGSESGRSVAGDFDIRRYASFIRTQQENYDVPIRAALRFLEKGGLVKLPTSGYNVDWYTEPEPLRDEAMAYRDTGLGDWFRTRSDQATQGKDNLKGGPAGPNQNDVATSMATQSGSQ